MKIKRFKRINNFAVFNNFNWDNGIPEFEKFNIIYGRNYSGKTTLSRILRSLETKHIPDNYESPSFEISLSDGSVIDSATLSTNNLDIRVFNEDFVRTNLRFLIDPNSEIEPFAILGSDNAEIENAIRELETEIGSNIEGVETGLYLQLNQKRSSSLEASIALSNAKQALERKLSDKATNRQTGIKYNLDRFGDQNYSIAKLKADIELVTAKSYTTLTKSKQYEYEQIIIEQPKEKIEAVAIPKLRFTEYYSNAEELLSRRIGVSNKLAELLRDFALNEWVKRGQVLLIGKEVCAFCGNQISTSRWSEINAHFDEESKKLEADIDKLIATITSEIVQLLNPFTIERTRFYKEYFKNIDSFATARNQMISDYCETLKIIINHLDHRKSQIEIEMALVELKNYSDDLTTLYISFNEIIEKSNDYTVQLSTKKKEAQKALRLQEVADFCFTIDYSREVKKIEILKLDSDNAEVEVKRIQNLLDRKNAEKSEKLHQLNDEEKGAQRVNAYLNDNFGHNFVSLKAENVLEGEKHIRFRIMRDEKPAYNLSEGECSLIAFCYFMAKLEDIDTHGKKPIVWIDDPISSLDSNHVFFVFSLIRAKLVETNQFEQLFISTHNLDFLKYLKRLTGKDNDKNMKYYVVQRCDSISIIIRMPGYLQNYVTEFNYLFHEVYKCSEVSVIDDSNYMTFYNFGNNARRFLEILMFYNYPDNTNSLDKLEKYFGAGRVPAVLTDRINNEYSHLCGALERGGVPTEVPEMLTTAKLIIETMKQKNNEQYSSLIQSVGVTTTSS